MMQSPPSDTTYPDRAVFCVDWDGTCVEEAWPESGDWLPGAVEALRYLSSKGLTVIYSLRCHEYEQDDRTLRPPGAQFKEVEEIRRRLDEMDLEDVIVYPNNRGKPPARYYIDDRAVRFKGNWNDTLDEIAGRELARDWNLLREERFNGTRPGVSERHDGIA